MNAQEKIAKLESLLSRVLANVAKPRPLAAASAPEPEVVAPPPVAAPAPVAAPPPVAAPAPVAAPPPVEVAPPPTSAPEVTMEEVDDLGIDDEYEVIEEDFEEIDMDGSEEDILAGSEEDILAGSEEDILAGSQEEAPASSRRAIAGSLDEALGAASAGDHRAVTPPPESGPVSVPAAAAAPSESDDIDDLLAVDVREPAVRPPVSTGPTMEQLGSTVEIDGADSADAELELEVPSELEVRADQDDLELEIPDGSSTVGTYDASLAPPPTAAADLARMDAKYSSTPEAPGGTQAEPAAASEADAHSVRRHSAPTGVSPAKFSTTAEPISVASFSELLDRSIALGK